MAKSLGESKPREVVGRDTTLRFAMQHQAAAFAALQILEAGDIKNVYCDFHDDFVVGKLAGGATVYHFFQVKTKTRAKHRWTLAEVFALKKRGQNDDPDSLKAVRESIAGNLLKHSIEFEDACVEVTLLTNVHFEDDVEAAVEQLRSGKPSTKQIEFLIAKFGNIFDSALSDAKILEVVKKFSLLPNVPYIGEDATVFASAAREAIHRYSEIDLTRAEATEIAAGLVALVAKKSMSNLSGLTSNELEQEVGVGINDLLAILSISPEAYQALLRGDDPKALRNASFIQRRLTSAGASDEMVEFASIQKVQWDIWTRTNRHTFLEFDFLFLLQRIDQLCAQWLSSGAQVSSLQSIVTNALAEPEMAKFKSLQKEIFFGGVMAALVKRETL
jgi:hypothetical protein